MRIMLTLTDMTSPSEPGDSRTFSVQDDDPGAIIEALEQRVGSMARALMAGETMPLRGVFDDPDRPSRDADDEAGFGL